MKSNVSGEDFNLVLWDISNVCHSMGINADIAKIVLNLCTDGQAAALSADRARSSRKGKGGAEDRPSITLCGTWDLDI